MAKSKTVAVTSSNGKTKCPLTRAEFLEAAKPLAVVVDGQTKIAAPKEYSTGSFGWRLSEKTVMTINGVPTKVNVDVNMIVVGSKESN